jgi:hypothetical protein
MDELNLKFRSYACFNLFGHWGIFFCGKNPVCSFLWKIKFMKQLFSSSVWRLLSQGLIDCDISISNAEPKKIALYSPTAVVIIGTSFLK